MSKWDPEKKRAYMKAYVAAHRETIRAQHKAYVAANRDTYLAQKQAYRAANREELREKTAAYKAANREKLRQRRIAYEEANRELLRQRRAAHYAANRAVEIQRSLAYIATHKEQVAFRNKQARARKYNAPICDLSLSQWREIKEHYGHRCVYCHRKMARLTMDHIIPLTKGGSHTVANIVPACRSCNSKKQAGPPLCPVQPLLLTMSPKRKKRSLA